MLILGPGTGGCPLSQAGGAEAPRWLILLSSTSTLFFFQTHSNGVNLQEAKSQSLLFLIIIFLSKHLDIFSHIHSVESIHLDLEIH